MLVDLELVELDPVDLDLVGLTLWTWTLRTSDLHRPELVNLVDLVRGPCGPSLLLGVALLRCRL